jgi:hypothetical protein
MKRQLIQIYLILFFIGMATNQLFAQSTQMEFGQNRVQYHEFYWSLYESENFITYYYPGGKEVGEFSLKVAEDLLKEVEEYLDYRINKKINILVYNDITDLGMTNIGLNQERYNAGGTTQILENKMFVYFDGDHQHLYNSIKEGIATILIDAMMFGGNFVEILQNAVLLNLPDWYKLGLASYVAKEWSVDLDNDLRKYFLSGKTPSFDDLSLTQPKLAGHSLWHYITMIYGKEQITEILYLTRVNRSATSGIQFTLGSPMEEILQAWFDYYNTNYTADLNRTNIDSLGESVKLKIRNNSAPSMIKIAPEGDKLAYAAQDDGSYKVFVLDQTTGKAKKILKAGFKSDTYFTDGSYPLIAWSPTGKEVLVVYEKRDRAKFLTYNLEDKTKERQDILNFQRIYGVEFIDAKTVALSGQRDGKSDIFTLQLTSSRIKQITNDIYDDLFPTGATLNGDKGILFSSNRHSDTLRREKLDSILPIGNLDLFFYNLSTNSQNLVRITNSPFTSEKHAQEIGDNQYAFISEENGIKNIHEGFIDSVYLGKKKLYYLDNEVYAEGQITDSFVVDSVVTYDAYAFAGVNSQLSDLSYNIKEWDVALKKQQAMILKDQPKKKRAKTTVQVVPLKLLAKGNSGSTAYKQNWDIDNKSLIEAINAQQIGFEKEQEEEPIDSIYQGVFKYTFQSEFNNILNPIKKENNTPNTIVQGNSLIKTFASDVKFVSSKVIPYRAKFTSNMVVTQLDNSINITGYENFNLNGGVYNYPDLSALITYGLTDVMEDHRLVAGFRLPTDFDGTEIFVTYNNLKKRLDWRLLFYRKSDVQIFAYPEGLFVNVPTIPGQLQLPDGIGLPNLVPGASGVIFVNPILGLSGKLKTHLAEATVSYPFDVMNSLRLHAAYRNERIIIQSLDTVGLAFPTYKENWAQLKLEFVHDNSKEIATNIRTGLRFKIWSEYHRNFNKEKANIFVTALDIRHYQKIYKNIIWANRVAYAASYGNYKIIYYLGGVDTWLNPKFDNSVPIDFDQNYAFQAAAVNMRGFAQNIRNGNSFALWNSEIRIPIFSTFMKRPIKLSFIRDFQIVGFFDAGLAYKGVVPWDDDNAFDLETIGQPPVEVDVNYYRRPTVFGMGAGIRTSVLGYFIRVDAGWGKDGSDDKSKPLWHISFSKDF